MCLINRDDLSSRRLFLIAQVLLIAFFLLQLPARHYPTFHPDVIDGLRGLLLGLVIGLYAMLGWKNRRRMA